MRITPILCTGLLSLFLVGCSDTMSDLKEAAAGINSKANEAATAISQDAHSVRAIEIHYQDATFTINDLFKTILRDVQWQLDKEDATSLQVKGTWLPALLADEGLTEENYEQLAVDGEVTVLLKIENHVIQEDETAVIVNYQGETILEVEGKEIFVKLLDEFSKK